MHPSAMINGKLFFDTYVAHLGNVTVVDIGAQDVNGSLRDVCPANAQYIGVDFANARGVDIVLTDPYTLPFENDSVDVVVSSSCLEHSEMFWLVFNEVLRTLKPTGLFYMNVPSNGAFHRYPVDCWRFYPDAGNALIKWAQRSGINAALIESYTTPQQADIWNDFVAVFAKDASHLDRYPNRILSNLSAFENGFMHGSDEIIRLIATAEDARLVEDLKSKLNVEAARVASIWSDLAATLQRSENLAQELSRSKDETLDVVRHVETLKQQIHEMESSISWKMTALFRALNR